MNWYQVTLTKDQIEEGTILTIQNQFTEYFQKAQKPDDMALFSEKIDKKHTKSQINLFFSPIAYNLAKNLIEGYFGYPCLFPKKVSLDLLAGSVRAWELFNDEE